MTETADRFICWPPSMLGTKTAGSVERHCRECLGVVWVAQSTLKIIRRKKIKDPYYWCVPCVMRASRRKDRGGQPIEVAPPQPEQIEEIEAELRRGRQ